MCIRDRAKDLNQKCDACHGSKHTSFERSAHGRGNVSCIGCHTIRGQEGVGITGPELTHVGARSTIAAGVLENLSLIHI